MTKLSTPVCNFGENAHDFELKGTDNNIWSLDKCRGDKGLLVMFICNHCPFVKAILEKLVVETDVLAMKGIGVVAINPNDYIYTITLSPIIIGPKPPKTKPPIPIWPKTLGP